MGKKKKILLGLLIALIVVIGGLLGLFYFSPTIGYGLLFRLIARSSMPQVDSLPANVSLTLDEKLSEAQQGPESYQSMVLTEEELNIYVQQNFGDQIPAEIKSWRVSLRGDRVLLKLVLDLNEFRETLGEELSEDVARVLRGYVTLSVRGRFWGEEGIGWVDIERLRLGFLPIPVSLIRRMIISKGSQADTEFLDKGFLLPEGFVKVEVRDSQIIINERD